MSVVAWYRELIGGRKTLFRSAARSLLELIEWPYARVIQSRNRAYDERRRPLEKVDARVISVGNLTVGGTGKTPFVAWLVRHLDEQGISVGIVSRGYGSRSSQPNDEARELARLLPHVPHRQHPRRVLACQQLLQQHAAQVIVADDAFQHRRLHRDLDIVLLDGLDPFGAEHLLPRGWLREPVESLRRADVVALTRCDLLTLEQRAAIRLRVNKLAPQAVWLEVSQRPVGLQAADGTVADLTALTSHRWLAFCAIGNPAGFRGTLANHGAVVLDWREFPDHHDYSAADLERVARWGERELEATGLLCTGKDLVKIPHRTLGRLPLWSLEIQLQVEVGEAEFFKLLSSRVANTP